MDRRQGEPDKAMQPEIRRRIERSMLLRAGEVGYRHVSVQSVFEGYGGYRRQFYLHFSDKAECFAVAYEHAIEQLCEEMLEFIEAEAPCQSRVEGALARLVGMAATETALAKALFIEVHVAGGPALEKRQGVMGRLARAIGSACREPASLHLPPPMTSEFVVGIVDQAVASALVRDSPGELDAAIPELTVILSEILRSSGR